MPILQDTTPSTPAEKRAAAQERLPVQFRQVARQQLQALLKMQNNGIDALWGHRLLTPQEACDALGTDAAELFVVHGTLTTTIAQMAAAMGVDVSSKLKLPTNAFTVNQDGTVTISEDPYVPAT